MAGVGPPVPPDPPLGMTPSPFVRALPQPWWQQSIWLVMALVCCPGIGLIPMWLWSRWTSRTKWLVTVVSAVVIVGSGVSDDPDRRATDPAQESATQTTLECESVPAREADGLLGEQVTAEVQSGYRVATSLTIDANAEVNASRQIVYYAFALDDGSHLWLAHAVDGRWSAIDETTAELTGLPLGEGTLHADPDEPGARIAMECLRDVEGGDDNRDPAATVPAAAGEAGTTAPNAGGDKPARPESAQGPYAVVAIVDGDTLKLAMPSGTETVRLVGIDTPETKDPRKPVQCFGREASDRATALLAGTSVWWEPDPDDTRDQYGRLLGFAWLEDGRLFNEVMIREGYAHEYTYEGRAHRYQDIFRLAETAAMGAQSGLWSPTTCNGDTSQAAAAVATTPPATTAPPTASPTPAPTPAPAPTTTPAPSGNCDPNYTPCIPPYPPDLDCPDIGHSVTVIGSDPHGLDRDGDGHGCESY